MDVEGWVDGIRMGEGKKKSIPEELIVDVKAEEAPETEIPVVEVPPAPVKEEEPAPVPVPEESPVVVVEEPVVVAEETPKATQEEGEEKAPKIKDEL